MNFSGFALYKKEFVHPMRQILQEYRSEILYGAAFPAYSHINPLFSFPFWFRIKKICDYLDGSQFGVVLDYGCGGGVMLPFLADLSERVMAADIFLDPLRKMMSLVSMPGNIDLFNLKERNLVEIETSSIDLVLALDVLEHVNDLDETLQNLVRVTVPDGKIIVSGPTENTLYKIGRKLAGHEFSGEYHTRCIYQIRDELANLVRLKKISTIYYPLPLFELYCGTVEK